MQVLKERTLPISRQHVRCAPFAVSPWTPSSFSTEFDSSNGARVVFAASTKSDHCVGDCSKRFELEEILVTRVPTLSTQLNSLDNVINWHEMISLCYTKFFKTWSCWRFLSVSSENVVLVDRKLRDFADLSKGDKCWRYLNMGTDVLVIGDKNIGRTWRSLWKSFNRSMLEALQDGHWNLSL